jgi:hypothetical protein
MLDFIKRKPKVSPIEESVHPETPRSAYMSRVIAEEDARSRDLEQKVRELSVSPLGLLTQALYDARMGEGKPHDTQHAA